MTAYVEREKLAEYIAEIPDDADQLIRYASQLVRKATRRDVYDVTPARFPSDPWIIDAFAEATCLQVAEWHHAGLNPAAGAAGQDGRVASSSLAGASVSYDTANGAEIEQQALETLCPAALERLRDEGLASAVLAVW